MKETIPLTDRFSFMFVKHLQGLSVFYTATIFEQTFYSWRGQTIKRDQQGTVTSDFVVAKESTLLYFFIIYYFINPLEILVNNFFLSVLMWPPKSPDPSHIESGIHLIRDSNRWCAANQIRSITECHINSIDRNVQRYSHQCIFAWIDWERSKGSKYVVTSYLKFLPVKMIDECMCLHLIHWVYVRVFSFMSSSTYLSECNSGRIPTNNFERRQLYSLTKNVSGTVRNTASYLYQHITWCWKDPV